MTERYEIVYKWVALEDAVGSIQGQSLTTIVPVDGASFDRAWSEATDLADDGWELVGAVPITAGAFVTGSPTHSVRDIGFSFTSAFILLFRRKIE